MSASELFPKLGLPVDVDEIFDSSDDDSSVDSDGDSSMNGFDSDDSSYFSDESESDDEEYLNEISQEMNLKNMQHSILQLPTARGVFPAKVQPVGSATAALSKQQQFPAMDTPTLSSSILQNFNARLQNLGESGTYIQTDANVTNNAKSAMITPSSSSASLQTSHNAIQSPTLNKTGTMHPQANLEQEILQGMSHGYTQESFENYFLPVTPLRTSSYSLQVTQAVRSMDINLLGRFQQAYMAAAARSGNSNPSSLWNACNVHGESLMHVAARRSNLPLLQFVLHHGGSLQVQDDYQKNPLHDAAWSRDPNFECVALILQRAPELMFTRDRRNFTPLQYVPAACYPAWNEFLSRPDIRACLRQVVRLDVAVEQDLLKCCMDSSIESQILLA